MTTSNSPRKKLIEVALPLPEINDASAYDKMPGIGPHPKGIHQWWARLPLPTARAVLFASVVDDPESHPEKWPTETDQNAERERLFDIMRRMMAKKLHTAPEVYAEATAEMLAHCGGKLPAVFDPFSGGGSIPLEANRLGFEAHAGDLNPVAVLLNKCNLEIAPRWFDHPPSNPEDRNRIGGGEAWRGTQGLAADIRHYGATIRERAVERIGHLYPKIGLPKDFGGGEANVIAWIWVRTVASPNPAVRGKHVPLCSTYWLSNKKGAEVWLEPVIENEGWRFEIRRGQPKDRTGITKGLKAGRATFECLLTRDIIGNRYINEQAEEHKIEYRLVAIIGEGRRGRIYLPATQAHVDVSQVEPPEDILIEPASGTFAGNAVGLPYGFDQFRRYYTNRQLLGLSCLCNIIRDTADNIRRDALRGGLSDGDAVAYSNAVITFLGLGLDRSADFNNSLCRWSPSNQKVMNLFGRQAIPMVWDFAEANLLGDGIGSWITCVNYVADCVETIPVVNNTTGTADQIDAASGALKFTNLLVSTDPPYYDNIGYASLSDFFYVWLRQTVGGLYKELFSTLLVPKMTELTAAAERYAGDKTKAKEHFEGGFKKAFTELKTRMDHNFPLTVYYAFKQDDDDGEAELNDSGVIDLTTGWETLLEALISSGFQITGTWPVRASQKWRMVSMGTNSLASYIVLACRPRPGDAPQTASSQFRNELKRTLPAALRHLQQGNIAPVDFAQAALGPGMAIYSRYSRILESSGTQLSIRAAINIINQTLTEVLSEVEDEFDSDTRWSIAWYEQYGFSEGDFGDAEILSKAKVTSVSGLQQAGILLSRSGNVRLLRPDELSAEWDPQSDRRISVWSMTHHLLRLYHHLGAGDEATAALLRQLGSNGDAARDLAYRLFKLSEKKKLSQEAVGYNALVLGWPEIARLAREERAVPSPTQPDMFGRA
ncbi:DUF1156 domain-containing protein [Acidiphilium sp. C61]|uniref:DUF1156 domain-containing protein n=1 Tax=Acidiphilium sp. C61 TaxID=1671485 RepID=UPI00157AFF1E|nr:DUF1156 domain-containing protein [Acidiphilium sp. C61]